MSVVWLEEKEDLARYSCRLFVFCLSSSAFQTAVRFAGLHFLLLSEGTHVTCGWPNPVT